LGPRWHTVKDALDRDFTGKLQYFVKYFRGTPCF
jgi:hypothetical protein